MDITTLKFHDKNQLLQFYASLRGASCTIDVRELMLSAMLTDDQIADAIKIYGVWVLQEESIY